jgi:hypothetical protein
MSLQYEAIIVTSDGTFRGHLIDQDTIAISEDGVEGTLDFLTFDQSLGSISSSPECLTVALTWWIYEHMRGLEIYSTSLVSRR